VEEIRESLGVTEEPRPVRKRNGAGDNGPMRESAPTGKARLIESMLHMGLSQKEAELFAE